MTTPSIVPSGFAGNSTDFNKALIDYSGAMREKQVAVTVPAATAQDVNIGLMPFRKGFRFNSSASRIYVADLDTGTTVTLSVGYVYDDNTNNTNSLTAFASASAAGQTGTAITLAPLPAGISWVATADGWLNVAVTAGPTTTAGAITALLAGSYDA